MKQRGSGYYNVRADVFTCDDTYRDGDRDVVRCDDVVGCVPLKLLRYVVFQRRQSARSGRSPQYSAFVAWREQAGPDVDLYGLLLPLLDLLGEVAERRVLDAGCGEGYLALALAARGAHVTGVDLSPRLIEQARARDPDAGIDYQVADLSLPLPTAVGRFDAVGSYLVLNDVRNYRGFDATVAASLKPGGRVALSPSSPTSPLDPMAIGQTPTCRPAVGSPATCFLHSSSPRADEARCLTP